MAMYKPGNSMSHTARLRARNQELTEQLAHARQVINTLNAQARETNTRLARREAAHQPSMPEDLARELAKARALFPEPAEVKNARLAALAHNARLLIGA